MSVQGINIPLDVGATIVPLYGKTGNNTAAEDSPSAPSPAVIYDMKNVMPSELGYSSAFDPVFFHVGDSIWGDPEYTLLESYSGDFQATIEHANLLKDARIQHCLPYETGSQDLVYLLLTELGIFLYRLDDSAKRVELILRIESEDPELYHLWTWAMLDNRLYLYLQGQEKAFIIGDSTLPTDAENWKSEFETLFEDSSLLFSLIQGAPTFLNMEGQVGLFQAGNRLGFWDSDNAVAWGSAFDKLDFTPDVVALSGITKFADVQGDIVTIRPTLEGFIIYSTASIVEIVPLRESTEKWGAKTILRGTGVDYHTHVAVGSNPAMQFAWTRDGLYAITNGTANPFRMEEWEELSKKKSYVTGDTQLYMLTAIGQRYLIISEAVVWRERPADVHMRTGMLEGDDGKKYPFYLPIVKPWNPSNAWNNILAGNVEPFPDLGAGGFELGPDPMPAIKDLKMLVPCYSGWNYIGPLNFHLWGMDYTLTEAHTLTTLQSNYFPDITFTFSSNIEYNAPGPTSGCSTVPNMLDSTLRANVPTLVLTSDDWKAHKSPGQQTDAFYDSWGEDFYSKVQDSINAFIVQRNRIWDAIDGLAMPQQSFHASPIEFPPCTDFDKIVSYGQVDSLGWEGVGYTSLQSLGGEPGEYESYDLQNPSILESEIITLRGKIETLPAVIAELQHRLEKRPDDQDLAQALADRQQELADATTRLPLALTELNEEVLPVYDGTLPPKGAHTKRQHILHAARGIPLLEAIHVTWDSCGLRVWAYIDDLDYIRDYNIDPAIQPYGHEDCSPSSTVRNNTSMSIVPPGDHGQCRVYAGISIFDYPRFVPTSFKGKTFDERLQLLSVESIGVVPNWVPIFEADVSGMGYVEEISSSWIRFIKTISRARLDIMDPNKTCTPSGDRKYLTLPGDEIIDEGWYEGTWDSGQDSYWPEYQQGSPTPPTEGLPDKYPWEWPADIYWAAKYRKGTKHPYYPRFEKAWVLDMVLGKWGSLDWQHSNIFPTHPNNSSLGEVDADYWDHNSGSVYSTRELAGTMPFGIIPKFHHPAAGSSRYGWEDVKDSWYPNLGNSFLANHQLPTFLLTEGGNSEMRIGTVALSREGLTKLTGLSGAYIGSAHVHVRASYAGAAFATDDPYHRRDYDWKQQPFRNRLSNEVRFSFTMNTTRVMTEFRAPFVLVGKEFEIAIAGHFRLHKLICYGQSTGRLSFYKPTGY